MKVLVIGAGVLGVSVARVLAVAGEDVVLLDRCGAGAKTSATTFAWTNANRKHDPAYHQLNVAGMEDPDVDPTDPPTSTAPVADTITQRLADLVPYSGTPELDLQVGFRSLPADGYPIAGNASPNSRVYCLISRSGITLAPVLGRLVATEVATDEGQDLLNGFRPTRFAGRHSSEFEVDQDATRLGEQ